MGFSDLPSSVEHLVIHFKKVGGDRPRYTVCQTIMEPCDCGVPHAAGHQIVKALTMACPIPVFEDATEHLHLIHYLLRPDGLDIFAYIAHIYAKAASRNPAFRLTLVGADEMDRECEADAAGDDEFERMIDSLPWSVRPLERAGWQHPPHRTVSETFLDDVTRVVSKWRASGPQGPLIAFPQLCGDVMASMARAMSALATHGDHAGQANLGFFNLLEDISKQVQRAESLNPPTEVGSITDADIKKAVGEHVKVLSSADYVAQLSAYDRKIEDWWAETVQHRCRK
jgi:hypothetical protein